MVMNLQIENRLQINKDLNKMEVTDSGDANLSKETEMENTTLRESDSESLSESAETVLHSSLKFGIDNILKENDNSLKEENIDKISLPNHELSLRNIQHFNRFTNNSRLLMNPYIMPGSAFLWPLKDISRDRQIRELFYFLLCSSSLNV